MLLEGKRIVITGGVTGIGKASALAMARAGASVVTMSRSAPDTQRAIGVVNTMKELGSGSFAHLQMDVTKQDQVNAAFDQAVVVLGGGIDVLVNSAGIEQQKPTEELLESDLYDQFAVHVLGTAFTNTAAFRYMKQAGRGSIVNYSSYAGVVTMPQMAAYGAAKAGVIAYTRVVAKEWGPLGVRANVVCPGVLTELAETWYAEMSAEKLAEIAAWKQAVIPLTGDLGKPEDAANLNVFLASDMSSFMTGQLIGVDGGMMMAR
jgi:3-oxoacyl-[acyl-carrier protein] reductase